MRKIEAVIRPEKIDAVREALEEAGFQGMTVWDVEGRGRQKGVTLQWRAGDYNVDFLPKVKLEVVVQEERLDEAVEAVCSAAHTGEVGDGKIFISDVRDTVRVRTGERGPGAL